MAERIDVAALFDWATFRLDLIASCIFLYTAKVFLDVFVNRNRTTCGCDQSTNSKIVPSDEPDPIYSLICEYLVAKDLGVLLGVSKDWNLEALRRIRFLLKQKYDKDPSELLAHSRSLSLELYCLETKDSIPLWANRSSEHDSPYDIECQGLGRLIMKMIQHSAASKWEAFHSSSVSMIDIPPREGLTEHPFGTLSVVPFRECNRVLLTFIQDFVTTAQWSFVIVNQTWFLTGQSSHMKPGYQICTNWSPDTSEDERIKPEFREKNVAGVGILEEAMAFWKTTQEYFLAPEHRVHLKPHCSLTQCSILHGPRMRCSRCKMTYYCSREHQSKHWTIHKAICRKQQQRPALTDLISAYRDLPNANEVQMSVFDIFRRKAMDLTTNTEWYID